MKELTISDLFDIFIDNFKVIILTIILFAVLSVLYTKVLVTPMYESSTKIILAKSQNENSSNTSSTITANDITLNQKLISTYSEIIKSRKVVEDVIKKLNLDLKYDDVVKNINVSPVKDSEVINISVENANPNIACSIANTIIDSFAAEVKNIYKIENVNQVDKAIVSEEPNNISTTKNLILFCIIGFMLSYGIAFCFVYFKTTISTPDEMEEITGLPVLAVIPDLDGKR